MYQHNIVVRWHRTNELEGLSAAGYFTKEAAERAAVAKADRKAQVIDSGYKLLTEKEFNALPSADKSLIRSDWRLSATGKGEY